MKQARRPWLLTFGFATLATAAVILLGLATQLRPGVFILFGVVVLISTRYGGLGPGLFATLLASVASIYLFLPPIYSLGVVNQDDVVRLTVFILSGIVIAWLTSGREQVKELARVRARQQSAVAELGRHALSGTDLSSLFDETVRCVCETLGNEFCQVLELLPDGKALLLRAGYGWKEELVGKAAVGAGMDSQAGYTLFSKEPVIVEDLHTEKRFSSPLLVDHGVVSGMSVIIQGEGRPFGVLGTYTTRRRRFTLDDVNFLQSIANVLADAIARQRSDREIRDQREWLSITLSSIGDGVIATDRQGNVTFINSVAQGLTGWNAESSLGKSIDQVFCLIDAESGQRVVAPVSRVIQDGTRVMLGNHVVLIAKDGHRVSIDDSAAPIRDGKGELAGVVLIFRDITERKQVEQALRDSEDRYRTVAETASDAILTIDETGTMLWANHAAREIFNYTTDEIVGQPMTMLISPGSNRDNLTIIRDLVQSGRDHVPGPMVEVTGRRKDGSEVPLEASFGHFVRDGMHCYTGILRDVSKRKKAEEQLQFQATILRNVRDSVAVVDLNGNLIFWNEASAGLYGYTADEMIGSSLALIYPNQSPKSLERDLANLRNGNEFDGEWRGRHKDGSLKWVTLKTTLLRDASGEPIGYLGVSTDITERKETERRLAAQYAVTRILAEAETIGEAAPRILKEISEAVGWQVGALWCLDHGSDVLRCLGFWREPELDVREFESLTREMLFPIGVGLPGRMWETRTPHWIKDVSQDSGFTRGKVALRNDLHSAMAFPIQSGDRFTGAIEFFSTQTRPPDHALTQTLNSLAAQIGQFIERKRTEEALRLSEEQHSIILQGVADGITAQDPQGRLIYANQAATALIGYSSPEELLQVPLAKIMQRFVIMDEEGNPLQPNQIPGRVAMTSKRETRALLRFRVLDTGEERWSQVNATPILDEQGDVQFAINIFHDVTEQRKADESIREQRELLQVTLASIGDGVISTDLQGKITFMNPVAQSLTGWKLEEALGKSLELVFDIVNEETREVVESPFTRMLREQAVVGLANHTMLIARNGAPVPIDDSGAPIRDARGNIIGVVLVFRDITERRKSERELLRLATIVKSSDDAIISQKLDGTIQTWNPGAERLYGYTAEEVIGKPITLTYPPDRMNEYEDIIARLLRGETVDHFDTVRLTKSGRAMDVSISVSLLRDAEGRIAGVSKIARDISDRKHSEKAAQFLMQASDALVSSLEYEATLASVARLVVPEIADWCAIDMLDKDGIPQRLALAHVDPAKIELGRELQRRYASAPDSETGLPHVIRTGKPEIYPFVSDEMIARAARDADHLKLLIELGIRSLMIVPLVARGRILGAITFVRSDPRRQFGNADLVLAQDLARRAALAVDNSRLYRQAQELNEELEHRVISRTIELQNTNRKLEEEVSERQRVNDQLRLLSGHLEKAREEERIRIAREIHDEIGQVLTAIKMDLSMLGRELSERGQNSEVQEEIESTTHLVDEAIQTMHQIVRELRPEVLDHLGLRSALEWQIQEFQSRTKIESRFDSELDDLDLDSERSTALFRILQEALTNVARHAEATQVEASLKQEDSHLVMQVHDNGKGISRDRIANLQTFGILGMRERARALGGDVEIMGLPGQGTVLTVRIPI